MNARARFFEIVDRPDPAGELDRLEPIGKREKDFVAGWIRDFDRARSIQVD